jgi:outer membrane lipopolysaccharide assembly protein LptE/RlpB
MKKTLLSLIAVIALSGCAVGNKHVYHDVGAEVSAKTGKSVAVASVDQREYVLSGQSKPELVGTQRGGFGNPFNVLSASGRALSSEFTTAIRTALERNGVKVVSLETKPSNASQPAMAALMASAHDRLLLLLIKEWIGDSQLNTKVRYDLLLTVADSSGKTLATKGYAGERDLGGSFLNGPGHAKEVMPQAFRVAIETLLNSPEIITALQ